MRGIPQLLGNPARILERETRLELATPTLARLCSTTELFPRRTSCNFSVNKGLLSNTEIAFGTMGERHAQIIDHRPQGQRRRDPDKNGADPLDI